MLTKKPQYDAQGTFLNPEQPIFIPTLEIRLMNMSYFG